MSLAVSNVVHSLHIWVNVVDKTGFTTSYQLKMPTYKRLISRALLVMWKLGSMPKKDTILKPLLFNEVN